MMVVGGGYIGLEMAPIRGQGHHCGFFGSPAASDGPRAGPAHLSYFRKTRFEFQAVD